MSSAWKTLLGVIGFVVLMSVFGVVWRDADRCSQAENCNGYRAFYQKIAGDSPGEVGHHIKTDELVAAYTYWLAVFTGGLFLATSGLWLATWSLWKTTRQAVTDGEKAINAANAAVSAANRHADESAKLVTVTRETAQRQLRAYISVYPKSLRFAPDECCKENPIRLYVNARNIGTTPAFNVQSAFYYFIDKYPLPDDFISPTFVPDDLEGGAVIFPTDDVEMNGPSNLLPDIAEKTRVMAKDNCLYIFCVVFYRDAFKETRHTQILISVGGPEFVALDTPWNADAKRIEEAVHYVPKFEFPFRHQKAE